MNHPHRAWGWFIYMMGGKGGGGSTPPPPPIDIMGGGEGAEQLQKTTRGIEKFLGWLCKMISVIKPNVTVTLVLYHHC